MKALYQTGVTLGSDFETKSIFIFTAAEVTITALPQLLMTLVSTTTGMVIIVIKSSVTHNVEVYHTTSAANNGTETLLVTLMGVDITQLNSTNIIG